MSWKHLSTFALAVLIVANIVFTVLVITEYEKNNYYDQSSIDEMTELLAESGISLSDGVIPKKRTDMRVYKASVSKRAFGEAASALVGDVITESNGSYSYSGEKGTYSFSRDFRFSYVAYEYDGEPGRYIAVSDKKAAEKVLSAVVSFMNIHRIWETAQNRQAVRQPEYKIEKLMVYSVTGALGAHIAEYIDGYKTGNVIDAVVIGDTVKSAEGQIMFVLPERTYKSKNADIFGVMINEKRRVDALGTGEDMTVVSVEYSLDLCFDVFGAAYLIPVLSVGYSDGTVFTYDVVSGERISE